MKTNSALAWTVALAAMVLGACQPPQGPPASAPPAEAPAETSVVAEAPPAPSNAAAPTPSCLASAHRNWSARLSPGAPRTLTISGQVDLPTPGYSVSLVRDEDSATTSEPRLTLAFRSPTTSVAQVVTPHPVYYFAPANGEYSVVHVVCDGQPFADIPVTR